jgi:hypothetical protein
MFEHLAPQVAQLVKSLEPPGTRLTLIAAGYAGPPDAARSTRVGRPPALLAVNLFGGVRAGAAGSSQLDAQPAAEQTTCETNRRSSSSRSLTCAPPPAWPGCRSRSHPCRATDLGGSWWVDRCSGTLRGTRPHRVRPRSAHQRRARRPRRHPAVLDLRPRRGRQAAVSARRGSDQAEDLGPAPPWVRTRFTDTPRESSTVSETDVPAVQGLDAEGVPSRCLDSGA